ncbi:MAG: helix-hairpin-helix domain-containing protein [Candidatus Deferrimicrobiaceae bacterium]
MGPDDLGQLKHVGASRRKLLRDHGITTIEQLHATPEQTLARIKTIGEYYAKRIKHSAAEHFRQKPEKTPGPIQPGEGRVIGEVDREFQKKIKRLITGLARVNEDFKPLGKQKYLELYVDLKKQSRKLKTHIREMAHVQKTLSDKSKKNIIKEAANLILVLKKAGKKPKKKKFRKITRKIQSLARTLQGVVP